MTKKATFEELKNSVIKDDFDSVSTILKSDPQLIKEHDKTGFTVLHFVKSAKMAELVIDHGAEVDAKTKPGSVTPLLTAINNNKLSVISVLLAKGAHVNERDDSGRTPLLWAIEKKVNPAILDILIHGKADVNQKSAKSNKSPLHYAAECGNLDALKILVLNPDINLQVVNADKKTILDVCKDKQTAQALGNLLREKEHSKDVAKYTKMIEESKVTTVGRSR